MHKICQNGICVRWGIEKHENLQLFSKSMSDQFQQFNPLVRNRHFCLTAFVGSTLVLKTCRNYGGQGITQMARSCSHDSADPWAEMEQQLDAKWGFVEWWKLNVNILKLLFSLHICLCAGCGWPCWNHGRSSWNYELFSGGSTADPTLCDIFFSLLQKYIIIWLKDGQVAVKFDKDYCSKTMDLTTPVGFLFCTHWLNSF